MKLRRGQGFHQRPGFRPGGQARALRGQCTRLLMSFRQASPPPLGSGHNRDVLPFFKL
eukprot:CAMPEP_0117812960 /NCGR_PEP_ID=MMETSP0948-20121206/23173_1 /TAXON_ID=44440 /ORGANISM="Chattonella subsalsa, Strain CCMP2191" /LENGTH=57 /DNA_ID=CAMNT_0005650123 /DNA_START=106 /DNA_END=276 /DNA_ORIENTATION=+